MPCHMRIREPLAEYPSHSAGLAGAFVDREVETRGLDFVDKEKAKYEGKHRGHASNVQKLTCLSSLARRQAHEAYDNNNGQF